MLVLKGGRSVANLVNKKTDQLARNLQQRNKQIVRAMSATIIHDSTEAQKIAKNAKTVAVLGIKTDHYASQPAYFVPEYLQHTGIKIIPVPVYYPDATTILGEPVVRGLKSIQQGVDILDVFRKPSDLPAHVSDILAMNPKPRVVWLQSGCGNKEVEAQLVENGITVVSNRCLKVDRMGAMSRY